MEPIRFTGTVNVGRKSAWRFLIPGLGLLLTVMLCAADSEKGEEASSGPATESLEVLDIHLEPVQQGKNVLHVKVRNSGMHERTLGVHINTRSPHYGPGIGWGTIFFETVAAGRQRDCRFAYKLQGPLTDDTNVRLRFYNLASRESFTSSDDTAHFHQRQYRGSDLERRQFAPLTSAGEADAREVKAALERLQELLAAAKYGEASACFTPDYLQAEFQTPPMTFEEAITDPRFAWFSWDTDQLLELTPQAVGRRGDEWGLTATRGGETWLITFVRKGGTWKIDGIGGYVPFIALSRQEQLALLLPRLEKRSTEHFDIYYMKDSTAQRELDAIVRRREEGYRRISEFIGRDAGRRITLVLFEDMATKLRWTAHQGMGLAEGNLIVEVYGPEGRLDPYHETAHILMGPVGSPPALFNEGFATYMSELMGEEPLRNLGGGDASLYARVRALKAGGEWIPLAELFGYTEIGSQKSRPHIAYAEAGAFVKFLVETYEKDRFLDAYARLTNSSDPEIHQRNLETLEAIYGLPLAELDRRWHEAFQSASASTLASAGK